MHGSTAEQILRHTAPDTTESPNRIHLRRATHEYAVKTALVLPTLNAGRLLPRWIGALKAQTVIPDQLLLIDSSSDDSTTAIARASGFDVHVIRRRDFSHGGTRQMAVELLDDSDILIFLTQDAFLAAPKSLEDLLRAFDDPEVGAAYGRQLPREMADPIEAHARLFNYPEESHLRDRTDVKKYGIRTSFISNSFAAWRRDALHQIGGFPAHTIQNEDAYVASKLILGGWKIAYCAEAAVFHSHRLTMLEEFRRYFDIGVFHARDPWIRRTFGQAGGEGFKFVRSELRYLMSTRPTLIPLALFRTAAKLAAFNLGQWEKYLPTGAKSVLTSNRKYWND